MQGTFRSLDSRCAVLLFACQARFLETVDDVTDQFFDEDVAHVVRRIGRCGWKLAGPFSQDYDDCVEALDRFRRMAATSPERVKEYEQLLGDLERDICRTLHSHKHSRTEPCSSHHRETDE